MARRKKTNEDEPTDNPENVNESDDNFGLPEIEYEPLDRSEVREETPVDESSTYSGEIVNTEAEYEAENVVEEHHHHEDHIFNPTEENSSAVPKVIGVLVVLLLVAVGAWFFMVYQPKKKAEAEKMRQEQLAREEIARKAELNRLAEIKRQEDEKRRADSLANATPKVGAIETLSDRTGRYYVVIASDIDDDLIMDYAKKLSAKGISSTIIPAHGKVKFFRIAVASGDTYSDAQSTADGLKDEYKGGAWVTRY
jgi:hypothetical protein